jgi:uncharacterized RDD family membrane protein YckC
VDEPEPPRGPSIASGAGFGIRAVARIIDSFYGLVIGFFGGFLGGTMIALLLEPAGLVAAAWQERMEGLNLAGWGFGLLGTLFYHWLTEGMYGASLGKLVCGLRVVNEAAQPIGLAQSFKRSLAYSWDALFFGLVGYSSMKKSALNQRYGDHWAKTVVIKARDIPAESKRGWEIFVLACAMGSVGWMISLALGLIIHVR